MNYAKRVDNTHAEIRDALRAAGWTVKDYSGAGLGIPDLLINKGSVSAWVECKSKGGKLTDAERVFFELAPGHKIIAYDGQGAVNSAAELE